MSAATITVRFSTRTSRANAGALESAVNDAVSSSRFDTLVGDCGAECSTYDVEVIGFETDYEDMVDDDDDGE